MTVDKAQELGEKFCREHFAGHQAIIVCTHADGHNHLGNIHCHIVINSLRIEGVTDGEYWAKRRGQAELSASGKPTKFETDKEKLRQIIRKALEAATNYDEFAEISATF